MRVVHVAECVGGVKRYLENFVKYSRCENIMILSQLYSKDDFTNNVECVDIMDIKHKIGFSVLKEVILLRNKIKKYNPDVVYAHSSIAGAIARMACIGVNVKVVYNPHGWSFNMETNKKNFYILLERIMSHFCDKIVCISDAEKKSALYYKIAGIDKFCVIYNGIDIESYKKEVASLPIPEDAFVVGMVGRICKQKAPDAFIRMAAEIKKKIPNSRFIIVGDVLESDLIEKRKIEDLANKLEVDLIITGWVNNPYAYINRFDIGCLLSRWEGFGLVIPEYMLSGVPIVASRVDAIPYLITDGVDGLLVDKNDWRSAADKVLELYKDVNFKEKLIKNGYRTIRERFDARRTSKESEKLFELLLNE